MRAVVDDRSLVLLNGGRPDRASMFSWALGSMLASLAGILIAPYLQLSVVPLTLLVVNAYAAAVIGRLRSLSMTVVGAIIIGLLQSYAVGYLPTSTVTWLQRIPDTIPIIVLFIALLVLPHQRLRGTSGRRTREAFPVPSYRLALIGSAIAVVGAIVVGPLLGTQPLFSMSTGFALGIVGLSLVPLVGYGGQISLCQMTYAGIGAVVWAHATSKGNLLGSWWHSSWRVWSERSRHCRRSGCAVSTLHWRPPRWPSSATRSCSASRRSPSSDTRFRSSGLAHCRLRAPISRSSTSRATPHTSSCSRRSSARSASESWRCDGRDTAGCSSRCERAPLRARCSGCG